MGSNRFKLDSLVCDSILDLSAVKNGFEADMVSKVTFTVHSLHLTRSSALLTICSLHTAVTCNYITGPNKLLIDF